MPPGTCLLQPRHRHICIDEQRSQSAYQNFIYHHTHRLRVLYLINLALFVTLLFTKLQLFDMTLSLPATAAKGEGCCMTYLSRLVTGGNLTFWSHIPRMFRNIQIRNLAFWSCTPRIISLSRQMFRNIRIRNQVSCSHYSRHQPPSQFSPAIVVTFL